MERVNSVDTLFAFFMPLRYITSLSFFGVDGTTRAKSPLWQEKRLKRHGVVGEGEVLPFLRFLYHKTPYMPILHRVWYGKIGIVFVGNIGKKLFI